MSRELQSRLIKFAGLCISIIRHCNNSYEGDYLSKQLIRSAGSSALNFGEAKAAESKNDFIHKQSICLKELRESYVNLLIMKQNQICSNKELLEKAVDEANQLVSMFVSAIRKCTNNNN